jgi:outer membrane protein assembly factor BamC
MIKFSRTGISLALAAGFTLACAACSTTDSSFLSKKIDYGHASKLPPLEVPPDLSKPKPEDRFSIPDAKATSFSVYTQERASGAKTGTTDILPIYDKVHMERAGNQRWIVVPGTPEKLWPVTKEFWLEQGFTLKLEVPEAGVMETDWAENRSKIPQDGYKKYLGMVLESLYTSGERDKFRTRLERGVDPNTTEVYVSHRGAEEAFITTNNDQSGWRPRPSDPELEAEMLGRLMVKFGIKEERARTVLAEQSGAERSRLVNANDGTGRLEITEPFDVAWRRVGLALDRVGFTVEERDRTKGVYFVRYVDPDVDQRQAEKGFFKRLFTSAGDKTAQRYRVEVKDDNKTSQVQVQSNEGVPDKTPNGKKILALLQEQLK